MNYEICTSDHWRNNPAVSVTHHARLSMVFRSNRPVGQYSVKTPITKAGSADKPLPSSSHFDSLRCGVHGLNWERRGLSVGRTLDVLGAYMSVSLERSLNIEGGEN
jgi:hypothetical protein